MQGNLAQVNSEVATRNPFIYVKGTTSAQNEEGHHTRVAIPVTTLAERSKVCGSLKDMNK